jgi:hypothetical protein
MHANNLIFLYENDGQGTGEVDQCWVFRSRFVYFNKYFSAFSASWQSNLKCNDEQLLRGGCLLH